MQTISNNISTYTIIAVFLVLLFYFVRYIGGWHPQPKMPRNRLKRGGTAEKFDFFERFCRLLIKGGRRPQPKKKGGTAPGMKKKEKSEVK